MTEHTLPPRGVAWPKAYLNSEIFTFVISGSLRYNDGDGARGSVRSGQAQVSRAGDGIRRIEGNPSATREVRYLRALIRSCTIAGRPHHQSALSPSPEDRSNLRRLASHQNLDGVLHLDQNVEILHATLDVEQRLEVASQDRRTWLHLVRGEAHLGRIALSEGDGVGLRDGSGLSIRALQSSELLLFRIGPETVSQPTPRKLRSSSKSR